MAEQFADVGDVTLCYETFGDPADEPLLLVMGLGTQMIAWHEDFCALLAERGFHVIRFDNRDVGRSTHFEDVPPPGLRTLALRSPVGAAYTLSDMAGDAAGLLDALDAAPAHVVGASMGGMIAQTVAAQHPGHVRSLVSIMSATGSRWTGQPAFRVLPVLLRRPPRGREAFIDNVVRTFGIVGSPGFERDEADLREMAGRSYDRGGDPRGVGRQLHAILASGNRTPDLARIEAPTLVVHGTKDRLVAPSGGRATARAISGARMLTIDGMGHDLPRGAWPQIADGIVDNARRAGGAGRPASQAA